jgi:predicted small metal-binding protein
MTKRVIECNTCGEPLSAANDEELLGQVRKHMEAEHADAALDDDQAREMISREAYDAGDA